jgi:molecular chaperone HscB
MTDQAIVDIVHNPDSDDHFEVLGVDTKLCVDDAQLTENYYALSRRYHPDFFHQAAASERVVALRRSAAVNDAYNVLRDPYQRGRWWLDQQGGQFNQDSTVPPDLIVLVFEVQDILREQVESDGPIDMTVVANIREEVDGIMASRLNTLAENFQGWDKRASGEADAELLDQLRTTLASISYIKTLLKDIDATIEKADE